MPPCIEGEAGQGRIGLCLALVILFAWMGLHIFALWAFRLTLATALPAVALVAVLNWLSVGLFIIAHDAMHGSLAPQHPAWGRRIGAWAVACYANFSFARLLPAHHAHHRQPGTAGDPDFHPDHPTSFWRWYGRFMRTYFGWRETGWMWLRVLAYLALGAPLMNILLFFALPGLLSSLQLFYFGTYLPHRHDDAPFADAHAARSNQYRIFWSLLSCFHFGYHHEHHLSPQTPWWGLPAKRRQLMAETVRRSSSGRESPH